MSREHAISRRSLLKTSGALGALAATAGALDIGASLFTDVKEAHAESEESIVWAHCTINCQCCCAHQCHVKDGTVVYTESDNIDMEDPTDMSKVQSRACLRGRSIRRWLQSPDRLNYPMKRVGKRGEGKFERISWEEALDTVANEIKRVKEEYGNEAIYMTHATGLVSAGLNVIPFERLLALSGGYLGYYGSPSAGQISEMLVEVMALNKMLYGSTFSTLQDNQLVVLFGMSVADTNLGGAGQAWRLKKMLEEKENLRVIIVDPRRNDTLCNWEGVEWLPIRPGTDAALVAALAYEFIQNGWIDEDYLHTYCCGWDEETLPDSAKGQNASWKDYILGTGYDKVPKTAAWASEITLIPEETIKQLAHDIGTTKPVFIAQGFGPQRRSNGENTSWALMLLPHLVGQVGLPGTNDGRNHGSGTVTHFGSWSGLSVKNPIKTSISYFSYPRAIVDWQTMTDKDGGVRGAERLNTGIKLIVNFAGNDLTNQFSDINKMHDILIDEDLCEFILECNVYLTDSGKYADIILPDCTAQEVTDVISNGYCDTVQVVHFGTPVYERQFERMDNYDICCELAKRLGIYDEFSQGGMTREDWLKRGYETIKMRNPQYQLPEWEEGFKMGVWRSDVPEVIGSQKFIQDPVANKLGTESGKFTIYSEKLAQYGKDWVLDEGDMITPVPVYFPGSESYLDVTEEYPLLLFDFMHKSMVHSSYTNNTIITETSPSWLWINPVDADPRNIEDGDMVSVRTKRGEIRIRAKVTERIQPGCVGTPAGRLHDADMNGDRIDHGGCMNTLASNKPSPFAKCNPTKSNIAQVEKVEA